MSLVFVFVLYLRGTDPLNMKLCLWCLLKGVVLLVYSQFLVLTLDRFWQRVRLVTYRFTLFHSVHCSRNPLLLSPPLEVHAGVAFVTRVCAPFFVAFGWGDKCFAVAMRCAVYLS